MKGLMAIASRHVVGVMIAIIILVLAVQTAESVPKMIRVETVDIVGQRVDSAIYMMSGVENGRTELNFGDQYGIEEARGNVYINYSAGTLALAPLEGEAQSRINPPVDFDYETGKSSNVCLINKPNAEMSLELGEC